LGQGKRSNQILGGEVSSAEAGYTGSNANPLGIGVDWQNHACEVSGTLIGTLEGTADTSVSADLKGTIENEPPSANAGGDQTVQCTSPAGAQVTLDGTNSTDPENNIELFVAKRAARARS